jgi:hypothetical protein
VLAPGAGLDVPSLARCPDIRNPLSSPAQQNEPTEESEAHGYQHQGEEEPLLRVLTHRRHAPSMPPGSQSSPMHTEHSRFFLSVFSRATSMTFFGFGRVDNARAGGRGVSGMGSHVGHWHPGIAPGERCPTLGGTLQPRTCPSIGDEQEDRCACSVQRTFRRTAVRHRDRPSKRGHLSRPALGT